MIPTPTEPVLDFPARRRPELEAMFRPRANGYLGSDVALSVPIDSNRTAWFFGDTLIGHISGGRRHMDAMPRNTIALQEHDPTSPARDQSITFHWRDHNGTPDDFLKLPTGPRHEWFWPGTGWLWNGNIYILGYGVVAAKAEHEALSFKITGMWCAEISNLAAPPQSWSVRMRPIFQQQTAAGIYLCSAHYLDGEKLYLFGTRRDEAASAIREGLLARLDASDLFDSAPASFEFWSEVAPGSRAWSRSSDHLCPIVPRQVSEATVIYDAPRARYLMTAYGNEIDGIAIRTSRRLEGPWSAPRPVYCELPYADRSRYLQYAARFHPQLASNSEELVLSYLVNPLSTTDLFADPEVYYPRFISLEAAEV